jgi:hypothetical protein
MSCGLTQEELDSHGWVDIVTQKCLVVKSDGNVCGCYYTQHQGIFFIETNLFLVVFY